MAKNKIIYNGNTLIDLTGDTVTADKLLQGYTAHDRSGVQITGTATSGGGGSVTQDQDGFIVLPPDGGGGGGGGGSSAELLQKWTYDKLIVEDEEITLPAWSSSSQILKASADLSPSVNCDLDDYNYFYVLRCLAYPIYKNNDDYAGKTEYSIYVHCAQLMCLPADKISSKSGLHISSDYITVASASQVYCIYWLNNNTVNRSNTLYGGTFTHTNPTYSNGTWTLKTPQLGMRGGSSYYSQTAYDNTDDIRFQYVIELYRTSKQDISVISLMSQVDHIVDNLNNNNWTLT